MANMANTAGRATRPRPRPQPRGRPRRFSAAEAKNQFGQALESAMAGHPVAITRYGQVKAILLSVEAYEALTQAPERRLDLLTDHFDGMLARMQTDAARRGMSAAFDASPAEMGRAAVRGARGRAARPLG